MAKASSLQALKKSSKANLQKLSSALNKLNETGGPKEDDRFWKPTIDSAGNGFAVIRFLPAPEGEDLPFVRLFSHAFKGPGGWYIENSLTTIGKDDPVSVYNQKLWASGSDASKAVVRKQKRNLSFISNVLIVSDPKNPSNDGKVMLFRYGKKIFEKINAAMTPEFEDEKAFDPFNFWEGANFKLKIRKVEGYRNYDKSEFDSISPLAEDDSDIEAIWAKCHKLTAFVAEDQFKSYDELEKRLERVIGAGGPVSSAWDEDKLNPNFSGEPDSKPAKSEKAQDTRKLPVDDDDDEDESLDYFKRLAEED